MTVDLETILDRTVAEFGCTREQAREWLDAYVDERVAKGTATVKPIAKRKDKTGLV